MSDPRTCTRCGTPDLTAACPVCTEAWENRRDASEMTPEERAAEFDTYDDILEIDFAKMHQRIEELVGRPVWTHEMASNVWPYLRHEILTGDRPTMDGILAKFPAGKPVIAVELRESDDA